MYESYGMPEVDYFDPGEHGIDSFTAIDFETMTAERSSACAIGLVKVIDGNISQRFYSLIKPIPDDRDTDNSLVHGITREMVANAPTFLELWPTINAIVGNDTLVAHNASFDQTVWISQLESYGCSDNPYKYRFICTFKMTELPLDKACKMHGIDIGTHHDALDDAMACAQLYLAENGHVQAKTFKGSLKTVFRDMKARKYDHDVLEPLDDSEIENQDTPFFHARTVITGVFAAYPDRNELGKMLKSLGADINTTISKRTDIVVVGDGAGPAKLKKIHELYEKGHEIRIIFEPELIEILS